MQADDRSSIVRFLRTDTAERNHVLYPALLNRRSKGFDELIRICEKVPSAWIGRKHYVRRLRSSEGFGDRVFVSDAADERFGTFRCEQCKVACVSADYSYLFSLCQKLVCDYAARITACANNDVHGTSFNFVAISFRCRR